MNELMVQLTQISGLAEGFIWHAALVFTRIGAALALLPALGEQTVPRRIKVALAVALTAIVAPAVPQTGTEAPGLLGPFGAEAVAGLLLGIGLRLLVLGLQTAGTLAAQSVSLSQMFNGTGPEPQPIVSTMLVMAGLALFMVMGGCVRATELMILSYDLIPQGQMPEPALLTAWGVRQVSSVFALAFTLAAPFVLASTLYNLALGIINRSMPQLMVSLVGAPALALGGLALLAALSPFLLAIWQEALGHSLALPFGG